MSSSRSLQRQIESDNDTLYVSYYPYVFETSTAIQCKELAKQSQLLRIREVMTISMDSFKNLVNSLPDSTIMGINNSSCDSRMYIQLRNREFCVGSTGCLCDLDNRKIRYDAKTVYLLKKISGYYNNLDSISLLDDAQILEFGIPDNYHYLPISNDSSELPIRVPDIVKVAIVAEKEL